MNVLSLRVDFAFLCDAAAAGPGGRLDARGIGVDTFSARSLPAQLPLLLIARLSGIDAGSDLSVRVLDADSRLVLEERASTPMVATLPGRPVKTPISLRLNVPTAGPGDYQLDLLADGQAVFSIPYWVGVSARRG